MSRIQTEIKQTKPFATKAQEAAVALIRTADLVRRNVAAVVEPRDITVQQYNVLRILRGAGAAGLPTLEIAERMIEQTPGITRLVDRLESKNLACRERCKRDRRQIFCTITKQGLALLDELEEPLSITEDNSLGLLNEDELAQLCELLDRSREGLTTNLKTTNPMAGKR